MSKEIHKAKYYNIGEAGAHAVIEGVDGGYGHFIAETISPSIRQRGANLRLEYTGNKDIQKGVKEIIEGEEAAARLSEGDWFISGGRGMKARLEEFQYIALESDHLVEFNIIGSKKNR